MTSEHGSLPGGDRSRNVSRDPTVLGIASASLLSDAGHEMATAVLPGFLRSLGAPAVALGTIEAAADAAQSFSKLAGGILADRAAERKRVAAAGYVATALGTGGFALAGPWGVVALFRALAWAARGARAPARDSLLAGAVTPQQRGRAFGLERAGDSVGAVLGPLVAAALLGSLGFKGIFVLSVIPGLLAAAAIWRLVEETPRIGLRETSATLAGLPRGPFRRFAVAYGLYGLGNFAPTLLVLHATELLQPGRSLAAASSLAVLLYTMHNLANAVAAFPAGVVGDRVGHRRVVTIGFALFGGACAALGVLRPSSWVVLASLFAMVGASTALVETARGAHVAELVHADIRGRAYGVLGLIDGLGDLAANLIVGTLFSVTSAGWGLAWGATLSFAGVAALTVGSSRSLRTSQ